MQVYDKLVKGYQKQGLLVKSPEPKFRLAMEIISWAPDDYRASTEVIKKINGLLSTETGYKDLNAFSHDLIMRLANAESPEEFKADNKTLTREKFYPTQPSTWLLNTHPNGFFDGLRQILGTYDSKRT